MILKKKKRYVLVEASNNMNLNERDLHQTLSKELLKVMGEETYSKCHPKLAKVITDKLFVLLMNRGFEDKTILALSFIKRINNSDIGFYTLKTSGTIKSVSIYARKIPE